MDEKAVKILLTKIRLALDRVPASTEAECLSKAVAYQGIRDLEQMMAEEVGQIGQHSAKKANPD